MPSGIFRFLLSLFLIRMRKQKDTESQTDEFLSDKVANDYQVVNDNFNMKPKYCVIWDGLPNSENIEINSYFLVNLDLLKKYVNDNYKEFSKLGVENGFLPCMDDKYFEDKQLVIAEAHKIQNSRKSSKYILGKNTQPYFYEVYNDYRYGTIVYVQFTIFGPNGQQMVIHLHRNI